MRLLDVRPVHKKFPQMVAGDSESRSKKISQNCMICEIELKILKK